MAMETTALPSAPAAQVIGNAFVEQYYQIQHHSPELVYRFYLDSSVLTRPDSNGVMTSVTTMKSINDMICSLGYKNYKAEIKSADAQQSYKDGVIVLVTGCLTGKDNMRKRFTQTFFLAPQDKGYFVLNDVLRYVEETETDNSSKMVNGVEDVPPVSLTPDPEPVHLLDPPNHRQPSSHGEEIPIVEEVVHGSLEDERLVGDERETVVGAESHVNEKHTSENAEPATSVDQEDAPRKSYASIVSSQTKKGPTKIYVPANSRMASAKKQPVNSVAQAPAPESSVPTASSGNLPESKSAQYGADGHSIYVRNLPLNVTVAQLEVEFKRFGPIKQGGIQVRSNRQQGFCFGFVEFEDSSSMNSAIKASPITVGGFQADVEMKRTTTRVGSGRGRFPPGRGGYRNDNFRGRGNFTGGQGYGRNDFVGAREFSGRGRSQGGRGGEGYQQGRGRGGRRGGISQIPDSA
ncbi:nuclear transport factor 2-like [Lycium ferocissimum]|uniref:nuclear transport factor 2-like n=1 Tax=Lycium ferocissimum TaxID=112874 RepID=UPI0028151D85|nr:nuclear transport factor 2-like [Lycium ferocissimum]XP_059293861.1 nuclear transport factor 2-like [Lycium ferocissimum]XP_059293862.1 nuclear transport factor 2-like [Lycium ferocissimum]XP_059293863.1 nuclear transport factor 2-like [Lycium ferocissimum]